MKTGGCIMNSSHSSPIGIVGGGLAGLTAATFAARAGQRVILFEKASVPGGRAVTHVHKGYHFNLGPHAVYLAGVGAKTLRELDIPLQGGQPSTRGVFALTDEGAHTFPTGLVSM